MGIQTSSLSRIIEHLLRSRSSLGPATFTGSKRQLLEQASRHRPEVVVADHNLLGKNVRRTIEAVRRAHPGVKFVLIVSFDWKPADADDFPVDACIRKSCIVRSLVPTVEALARQGRRRSKTNGGFHERAPRGVRMK